ncbi:MAG: tripartite tricarboxylate transporter TctB family protein [Rhodospirillales bacterium]|nr:tripartite tricarboxylate transporter TctB family protein [Rhodospirillales bacterium]MSP80576.1 tripartite tricarboxylate transporter TctB family protein [Rhodospirillales bacterium]
MIRMRVRLVRALPFFIVLGVGFWLWHESRVFALARPGYVGPEVWPRAVLVLLIASAVVGAVQALVRGIDEGSASALIKSATRTVGREGEVEADLQIEAGDPSTRRPLWAGIGIVLLLGFVVIIPYLGFTLTTFLLMFGVILCAGYQRPLIAGVTAALGTLAFFVIFQRLVYVSLPLGVGPFKELSITLMAAIGVR